MTDEEEIDLSEIDLTFFKEHKLGVMISVLAIIVILAFVSRTANVNHLNSEYLISPDDPYIFLRYSKYVAEHGELMKNDTMRYFPMGANTERMANMITYVAGHSYNLIEPIAPNVNMYDIGAYLPPISFVISLIVFFFLVRELFDNKTGLVATGLLAFSSSILFRTTAGFLEKEPIFLPFFFGALLAYIKGMEYIKEEKFDKRIFYSLPIIAGVMTGLAGFSSGLFIFIMIFFSVHMIIEVLLNRINKEKMEFYTIWFVVGWVSLSLLTTKYTKGGIFNKMQFIIPAIGLIFAIVGNYVNKPKKFEKQLDFIPSGFFKAVASIVVLLLIGTLILGPSTAVGKIEYYAGKFMTPMAGQGKFISSVSESQPGSFGQWVGNFGPYGIVFALLYAGSIFLLYDTFKEFKGVKYLVGTFFLFITSLFFENIRMRGYEWITTIFGTGVIYTALFGVVALGFIYYNLKAGKDFKELHSGRTFLIVWYVLGIAGANGSVRLFFMMGPVAAILAAYMFKKFEQWATKYSDEDIAKIAPYILAGILILFSFQMTHARVSRMNPNLGEYKESLTWAKENTPQDSVFIHWWDYGYVIQALANRTTVIDPGNWHSKWNFDVGGHLFCGKNSSEIKSLLDRRGTPEYFFVISEDVMKFYQISRLGAWTEYKPDTSDRAMYFSLYVTRGRQSITPNYLNDYQNYSNLVKFEKMGNVGKTFEDFKTRNKVWGGNDTYITNFLLPVSKNETGPYLAQIVDGQTGRSKVMPVKCKCVKGEGCDDVTNETAVPTCVLQYQGGVLNVPYKSRDYLFTKLYLLEMDVPGFEVAYDNEQPLGPSSIAGGKKDIKIYEINYTELSENITK